MVTFGITGPTRTNRLHGELAVMAESITGSFSTTAIMPSIISDPRCTGRRWKISIVRLPTSKRPKVFESSNTPTCLASSIPICHPGDASGSQSLPLRRLYSLGNTLQQAVAGHLRWLRQTKQEEQCRRDIGQDSLRYAKLICVRGDIDQVDEVGGMSRVRRAIWIAHQL